MNYSPASHIVVIFKRTDTTSPSLIIIESDLQCKKSRETFDLVVIVISKLCDCTERETRKKQIQVSRRKLENLHL